MQIIALLAGLTMYLFVIILLQKKDREEIEIEKRVDKLQTLGNRKKSVDEEEYSKPLRERLIQPIFNGIVNSIAKRMPKENNTNLKKQLKKAGIKMEVSDYNALRVIVIIITGLVFFVVELISASGMTTSVLWAMIGIILGYAAMTVDLRTRAIRRSEAISFQLPEVLDLLSISVEAGLGFDQALSEVCQSFNGPLIEELKIGQREMQLGRTKKDALNSIAERAGVEELSIFVSAVVQGEQFGISLKNILRTQSFAIRLRYRQRIEEKAAKLPVKIILPTAIFIFPVIFIVVLGPTIFNLLQSLGTL